MMDTRLGEAWRPHCEPATVNDAKEALQHLRSFVTAKVGVCTRTPAIKDVEFNGDILQRSLPGTMRHG